MDVAHCKDLPLSLVFLPASDIAKFVGEGNVDLGITGLDNVYETKSGEIKEMLVRNDSSGATCGMENLISMTGFRIREMQAMHPGTRPSGN